MKVDSDGAIPPRWGPSIRPDAGARGRRVLATAQDLAVSGAVSGLLVAYVLVALRPDPVDDTLGDQLGAALRDTTLTVLPAVVVCTADDLGRLGRLGGKGRLGLEVRGPISANRTDRPPLRAGRAVLRNVLKFLPWQLAHLGVRQVVSGVGGRAGSGAGATLLVAGLTLLTADVVLTLHTGTALHDRLAGTRVHDPTAAERVGRGVSAGGGRPRRRARGRG